MDAAIRQEPDPPRRAVVKPRGFPIKATPEWFKVLGLGFKVWGLGFGVWDVGLPVQRTFKSKIEDKVKKARVAHPSEAEELFAMDILVDGAIPQDMDAALNRTTLTKGDNMLPPPLCVVERIGIQHIFSRWSTCSPATLGALSAGCWF